METDCQKHSVIFSLIGLPAFVAGKLWLQKHKLIC